jgi:uncharacterized protein (TIGR03435 family)
MVSNYVMISGMSNRAVPFAMLLGLLGGVTPVGGQALPRFEVASIKLAAPDSAGSEPARMAACRSQVDAVRLNMPCASLKSLINIAFNLNGRAIERAPAWADTQYKIEAKAESAVGIEQMRLMLQALLAERFQLKVHRDAPLRPAFVLVVAKGGPKLKPAESGDGQVHFSMAGKEQVLAGSNTSLALLIPWLRSMSGQERPVVDQTGLTSTYDFRVQWLPDADAPSVALFPALQEQLGLRMEARNAPVEVLVVDSAEKPAADE